MFQSTDNLVLIFTALVCLMNRRDNPELDIKEIQPDDLSDLIQLAQFYQSKTPVSFLQRMREEIQKGKKPKADIKDFLVLPVSAEQVVKVVNSGFLQRLPNTGQKVNIRNNRNFLGCPKRYRWSRPRHSTRRQFRTLPSHRLPTSFLLYPRRADGDDFFTSISG